MKRTILPLPLLALALLAMTTGTAAAKPHRPVQCHVPNLKGDRLTVAKHKLTAAHCALGRLTGPRTGRIATQSPRAGRTVRRNTKVTLTFETKTKTTLTFGKTTYSTAVDPTFTQNPSNPFDVTYTYDAVAVENDNGTDINLADSGQLPAGILNFYSAGTLKCSMNVGGAVTGGTCEVIYPVTGTYQVTTEYIPNSATAVEETDQETINPFATTVDLATAIGAVQGNYFNIGVAWNVLGPDSQAITLASSVVPTYTITDTTTGQTVGTWTGPAGQHACYIVDWSNGGGTMFFNGGSCWNGNSNSVSISDSYELEVSYPGQNGYTASTSIPQGV